MNVIVVGGGIIGLTTAWYLVRAGHTVTVLEDEARVGTRTSHVAAGMLAPASEVEATSPALLKLALHSLRLFPGFVGAIEQASGQSCGLRREGTLLCALTRDHEAEWSRTARIQADLGLRTVWLEAREVLAREPRLSPRVLGAWWAEDDVQVDPRRLILALTVALTRAGVTLRTGCHGFILKPLAILINSAQRLPFDACVLAGGAWTTEVLGATSLPLRPVKGQALRLRGPALLTHVIRTPEVYLVPRTPDGDAELIVGATMEEQGFDPTVTAGAVLELLREAGRVVPGIAELALAETNVGFRPALRDNLPAIGPTRRQGVWMATGHYRHGVLLAPATGALLAEALTNGRVPEALAPFSPERFAGEAA